ncbi:MAG: TMEM175 family protein [Methanoregula sp.]|nr:TMEM175 family protein [Methanoregula sp.]
MQGSRLQEGPVTKTNIGRLTNAIFAFTFLLLFRNIRLPSFEDYVGNATAQQFGLMQAPDIINFLSVFVILAMIWVVTFHVFHKIERLDWTALYFHFLLLMFVIFIPISSNLTTIFSQNTGVALFFHMNMLAIGAVLLLEWMHCRKTPQVIKPEISRDEIRLTGISMMFIPFTAGVGCVLANYDVPYTQYIYFGTMVAFVLNSLRLRDRKTNPDKEDPRTPDVPAPEQEHRHAPAISPQGMVPLDMLEILVNGVFAFAMTLIVKNNIPLPTSVPADELDFLVFYLAKIMVDGFNFIFTFMILAFFYILFFEIMRHTRIVDRMVVCISFGFILSVLFVPLTSLLWSLSDMPIPYGVIFHANILLSGLLIVVLWQHVSTNPLLQVPGTGRLEARDLSWRLLLFPLTSVAGLILDSWDVSFQSVPLTLLYFIPVILFVWLSLKAESGDVQRGNTRA